MATVEQIEKLKQYTKYTILAIKANANPDNYVKVGAFEQRVIARANQHLASVLNLAEQVRLELDREIVQERTPYPFNQGEGWQAAVDFVDFLDTVIERCK
jgi:hypothetical protein